MRLSLIIMALCCSMQVFAQDRYWMSTPLYGQGLWGKLPTGDYDRVMADKDYNALSLRDKFAYHMVHAETFSQICAVMPSVKDEHKKIFGFLPDVFGDYSWSQRQYNFLKEQRDSVMAYIKESVQLSKRVGLNYKYAVIIANGWEMIPFLISTYNASKKDHDILTVLMRLMQENQYVPFMTSATYIHLYGGKANYRTYLEASKANRELIIDHANNFYKSRK